MNTHPAAEIFPRMSGTEYEALRADIAEHGLREPVWTYQGMLLDGRHRMQACGDLGIACPARECDGDDPVAFVVSVNLKRRHLNESQRAVIAARISTLPDHRPSKSVNLPTSLSQPEAAELLNVSVSSIGRVKRLEREAPELLAQVAGGEKTVTQGMRELKERVRAARRADNAALVDTASSVAETVGTARFATIVIDPPWDWGDEGDVDQLGRARTTYNALSFDELLAYPVGETADEDAHLYLWITNRSLPKGFALLERWGFRYVTCLTWCKPHFGMGNYFRGQTEHVLFGVKGSQALKRKDVGTWFAAPRGPLGHSSKPTEFYSLVESCSPGPYLEMFARGERDGWTSWGAEIERAA